MKVDCDGGREARGLFSKARHSGIAAAALIAVLVGVHAKPSDAAEPFRAPVLNAKSDHVAAGKLASDVSGYIVVAAANQSAGPLESNSGVRNTDTPGRKNSDLVPANNALTSAVPEPLNYAMMLAGLGLMGFVATRRQL